MAKEKAFLDENQGLSEEGVDSFDFDGLEEKLQRQLEEEVIDLKFLADEKEKIGNTDNLGNVIMEVVWEQFMNQVAVTAGEDFIKENNDLKLNLRNEAHIQTTENFHNGNIATHNTKINYQERYDDWQSNFVKDEKGNVVTHTTRSGKKEATLVKGARKPFDNGRPSGSAEKHTDMDHTVSAAEIIRDPGANAHMTKEQRITFANSEANLNEMDSSLNRSKGDKSTSEWLDNPNASGQKPREIFDISDEDDKKLRQKDTEAREEFEKQKKEGEQKSIAAGKQSQKEEAFRIGKKAIRAVVMQLLADLVKEIIAKLVKWFKSAQKGLNTLLDSLKQAIHSFISKMKTHLINIRNTVVTTIGTAIIGPVCGTIRKVWMLLKQGCKALKDAINYIKSSENKGKPIGRLLLETGKIIVAGLTGAGSLVLGEVIEKGLMTIPVFAVEIPLIGSLANILGIFFGTVVAGIIGAIAINLIEKRIEKSQKLSVVSAEIKKENEIIKLQHQARIVGEARLKQTKEDVVNNIRDRHVAAGNIIDETLKDIGDNCKEDESIQDTFDEIDDLFDELEGGLL
nr:cation diffusion facilitator family transporter [uncultured Niameybacter sp.]